MKRYSLVPALAAAAMLLAGPSLLASGTSETLMADSVKARLVKTLGDDAGQIEVRVIGDRVLLLGVVDSRETEELAEEVALSVPGIRKVKNRLELRKEPGPVDDTGNEFKDAILEARVKHILMTKVGKNVMDIEVEAANGTVALRGHVRDSEVARAAIARTRNINGVRKVINLLDSASFTAYHRVP